MNTPEIEIIQTEDGSHTLRSLQFDQRYHSYFGALQESIHVFLNAGLLPFYDKQIEGTLNVAEMGFGTGLNAYLVALEAKRRGIKHTYLGLEKYPISVEQAQQLNYAKLLNGDPALFTNLHRAEWGMPTEIDHHFTFRKELVDIKEAAIPKSYFHTFFYDAFSPDTQPELWTEDCLKIAYDSLVPGGTLVTYCAKGDVKRALKSIGFSLEKRLPGPGKKREMTRATKV